MSLLWTTAQQRTIEGGPNGEPPKGMMVAIVPPEKVAQALVQEGGETWDNMHVTLAYLPYESNSDDAFRQHLGWVVQHWARKQSPLNGQVAGVGVFQNPDNNVLYASVDIPGLEALRQDLVEHLARCGYTVASDHGFTPHMTLAYCKDELPQFVHVGNHEFPVDEVWACVGPHWESFPLG